jgi:four helix bundle protein
LNRDLDRRLFLFAVGIIRFLQEIKLTPENNVLKNQLTKSSTSSGANYEEAQAASSKADFKNKILIALREMRESNYWLRILQELKIGDQSKNTSLLKESDELKRILGSIASKVK